MRFSNWAISLEFDLEQTSSAIKEIIPLYAALEKDLQEKNTAAAKANEAFRDIHHAMSIIKQRQAELLHERFADDEMISDWLNKH